MIQGKLNEKTIFLVTAALIAITMISLSAADVAKVVALSKVVTTSESPKVEVTGYQALPEDDILLMSLMWTESKFNPEAYDGQGSVGILQIRQVYVNEVNRILGEDRYTLDDARDIEKSLEMFKVLQNYHNPKSDFSKTIYYHNKSKAYEARVIRTYNSFLAYERMREKLIKIRENSLEIEE